MTTSDWYPIGRYTVLLVFNGKIYGQDIDHFAYALQGGTCFSCIATDQSNLLYLFYDISVCELFYIPFL